MRKIVTELNEETKVPFILLFIYFNYMARTGYDISVFEWGCLFVVGLIQVMSWFVQVGILTSSTSNQVKRVDEWFRD